MSRGRWRIVLAVAVAVQCYALYWPSPPTVDTGLPLDKAVHLLLFGGVALIGVLAGVQRGLLVGALLVQAVVSELVQGTMAGRSADGWDLLLDVIGIGLGVAAGVLVSGRRRAAV